MPTIKRLQLRRQAETESANIPWLQKHKSCSHDLKKKLRWANHQQQASIMRQALEWICINGISMSSMHWSAFFQ